MGYTLAIDPGTTESAWCLIDSTTLQPVRFAKESNDDVIEHLGEMYMSTDQNCIEMLACYGMPVGQEVLDTCVWVGRFIQYLIDHGVDADNVGLVFRKDEKMTLCHSMKATDATITQALVDRFAYGQKNHGKGTKKDPGFFYGFKKDIWQAYAVGVTYLEMRK